MSTSSTKSISPVSLLQQHRPNLVTPLTSRPSSPKHEDQPNPLETHELHCHQARGGMYAVQLKRARSQTPSTRSNSRIDLPPLSRQHSPVASSSSGARYLNRDPATRLTCITATPISAVSTEQVESALAIKQSDSATDLLTLATEGSHGLMKPKSEWQKDDESAFCSITDCTAFFPTNSRFHLLPTGRHHCRLCGLTFCSAHSSRCLPLTGFSDGVRRITRQRVCDTCVSSVFPSAIEHDEQSGSGSEFSRIGTEVSSASTRSDALLTPEEETFVLSRTYSAPVLSQTIAEEPENLAPIESWMDSSGVLSLYPLAARSSRCLPNKPPAAARLFRPTIAERRMARERSVQRQEDEMERRKGQIDSFWLPLGVQDFSSRASSRRNSLAKRTPDEQPTGYLTPEERAADWSSF